MCLVRFNPISILELCKYYGLGPSDLLYTTSLLVLLLNRAPYLGKLYPFGGPIVPLLR